MRYVVGCSVIWVIFVVSENKQLSCLALFYHSSYTHLCLMLKVNKLLPEKSNFEPTPSCLDLVHYICSSS